MNNIALLVVDMQNSLVEGHPYNIEVVVEHIKKIISLVYILYTSMSLLIITIISIDKLVQIVVI